MKTFNRPTSEESAITTKAGDLLAELIEMNQGIPVYVWLSLFLNCVAQNSARSKMPWKEFKAMLMELAESYKSIWDGFAKNE